MVTIRLVPSTYYLSNTSYLSVSNANNMCNNTDNDTYATVTNSQFIISKEVVKYGSYNFSRSFI